jgi:ring-1,2-phenylacetyl-CoA epoxidase subunit PaaA
MTMPEERFHAQFGRDFCAGLCKTPEGRARVQDAINRYYPLLPSFFGKAGSKNNELFRAYGIKQRTNEDMRADYVARARALVEDFLGLRLPEAAPEAA